jgi:WhiB family redox-sensing transcriptional regulator
VTPAKWAERAACRDVNTNLFYPIVNSGAGKNAKDTVEAAAIRVCAGCEVRLECLTWAIEHNEKHGVWGGMGEAERARHRRFVLDIRRQRSRLAQANQALPL